MPKKNINKAEVKTMGKTEKEKFVEVSDEEFEAMTAAEQEAYKKGKKKHDKSVQKDQEQKALEAAKAKMKDRIALLEEIASLPLAKRTGISCEQIDVTFACPIKKVNTVNGAGLISPFYEGDLVQVNCHAIQRMKVPCVVVKNGVLYFAQKIDEEGYQYQNLDSNAPAERNILLVDSNEFIGEIVNIISTPRKLFEKTPAGKSDGVEHKPEQKPAE